MNLIAIKQIRYMPQLIRNFFFVSFALKSFGVGASIATDLSRFQIIPGFEMQSQTLRRGLSLYDRLSIHPALSLGYLSKRSSHQASQNLYRPALHLSVNDVRIETAFHTQFSMALGLGYFFGREAFEILEKDVHLRRNIQHSYELIAQAQYLMDEKTLIGLEAHQDLNSHQGFYGEVSLNYKLFKWMWREREFAVFHALTSVGAGSSEHNEYLYGPGAEAGINTLSAGVEAFFEDLWGGVDVNVKALSSHILFSNREAEFSRNSADHFLLSLQLKKAFSL